MGKAVGDILPLALGVALSPLSVIAVILLPAGVEVSGRILDPVRATGLVAP